MNNLIYKLVDDARFVKTMPCPTQNQVFETFAKSILAECFKHISNINDINKIKEKFNIKE